MDFKVLGKDKKESKSNSPMVTLPCGLFCVLGEDTLENDKVKYKGQFSLKYGKGKTDWVRMSYVDSAALYAFMTKEKDFINAMIKKEQDSMSDIMI
jgi:hypothetical protein